MPESPPDTRLRLLDAAIEEFADHGYDQATVRDICGRAGANVNAVSYYFGDKQSLYVEAVKAAHRATRRPPGAAADEAVVEPTEGDPEQRLRAFIQHMVARAMATEHRTDVNHKLMFREIAQPTIATEEVVREYIEPLFRVLGEVLDELMPADADVVEKRLFGMSVVGQCMHYKLAAPIIPLLLTSNEREAMTPDRVAEHIAEVTLAAIRARSGAPAQ